MRDATFLEKLRARFRAVYMGVVCGYRARWLILTWISLRPIEREYAIEVMRGTAFSAARLADQHYDHVDDPRTADGDVYRSRAIGSRVASDLLEGFRAFR